MRRVLVAASLMHAALAVRVDDDYEAHAEDTVGSEIKAPSKPARGFVPVESSSALEGESTDLVRPMRVTPFECSDEGRVKCMVLGESPPSNPGCKNNYWCAFKEWKHKENGPYMPCCAKKGLLEILVWFNDIVGEWKADKDKDFWFAILWGTLMGAERKQDIIDYDSDVDVGIPKEKSAEFVKELERRAAEDGAFISIRERYDSHLEIVTTGGFMDMYYVDSSIGDGKMQIDKYTMPTSWMSKLDACTIQGHEFPCFSGRQELLAMAYGEGWKTPKGVPAIGFTKS